MRTLLRHSVWLLLLVVALPSLHAIILPPIWRWSNPTPLGATIYNTAYINGTYVLVGECGQIFTSGDAQTWAPCESGTSLALRAVTLFGGRVVITGENGTILASDDLVNFYSSSANTTDWLEGVAASPSVVVAAGDNGAIYVSTNAVSWQRMAVSFTNIWLSGIAYGSNTFVVVGENGFVATSQNGTTWTPQTSGASTYLNWVAWLDNQFLATGEGGAVFTSPNGTTWQAITTGATNSLYAAAGTTNSQLVAGNLELRLKDTGGWSNQISSTLSSPAPSWPYYCAAWDTAGYLVAGLSGMMTENYLTNGPSQWYTETNSIRVWLWALARTPASYIAVGNLGTILSSPNGIDWEVELTPTSATNSVLLGVGGSTNFFLIAGSQGTVLWATNTFLWNALGSSPTTNDLQGVCFDGYRFLLCGGNGTILASPDGTNWTQRTTPTTAFLMSMDNYPGGLVAVGDQGVILTSANSTNWTAQTSGTTNWFSQVRYLNGLLMAVGENGTILVSTNGANWAARTSGVSAWLNAIDCVDGVWFIAGNQGTVLISTDTTNWVSSGTITKKSLYGLVIYQGQLVTVGAEGVIIRSQLIPATTPVTINQYSRVSGDDIFLFTGQPDQEFYLNASTNLSTWSQGTLLDFLDSSGTLLYTTEGSTNAPQEFFRTSLAY
jgi:hypothetical protein